MEMIYLANTIQSIQYGGYTYSVGDTIKVKNNYMYTTIISDSANTINMLTQCVMKISAIWEGTSKGVPVKNPLQLKWHSGPAGSYNGGGFIRPSQIVTGSGGHPNTYTIKYIPNGASGTMPDQVITYGVNTQIRDCTFQFTGHTFRCWWRTREYDNAGYGYRKNSDKLEWISPITDIVRWDEQLKNGSMVAKTAPYGIVYLHAQWDVNTYTITYKSNDGTNRQMTQSVKYGQNFKSFSSTTFTRPGYQFQHWIVDCNLKDTWAAGATAVYRWDKNITMCAVWKRVGCSTFVNESCVIPYVKYEHTCSCLEIHIKK